MHAMCFTTEFAVKSSMKRKWCEMRILKITHDDQESCIWKADHENIPGLLSTVHEEIRAMLEEACCDKIVFELKDMSLEEYEGLPEFQGW